VTATGSNDGSSWATPAPLQAALAAPGTCTEIWVAKGLYKPTATTDTSISFSIANNVAVYGGFAGGETLRTQRDPGANLTVLSGDIDNNDTTDASGVDADTTHIVGSNSKTVVLLHHVSSTTALDGFTITGGDNRSGGSSYGGGLICDGSPSQDGPLLSRLVFIGNAALSGGAIYNNSTVGYSSNASLSSVTFIGNRATQFGGAIYNNCGGGPCTFTLSGATFNANSAGDSGGAIYTTDAGPSFSNVTFVGNHASKGGAFFAHAYPPVAFQNPLLNFVTFSDNVADTSGGAIASTGPAHPVLHNAILWGDHAPLGFGAEIDNEEGATTTIDHSIVKDSGGSAAWNPSFGTDGGGNLDVDPRLGPLLASRLGATQTLLPGTGSPAIDAGNDTGCPAEDERGIVRPQGAHCDIGAVETFPIDLIGHKGLEACWSQALAKPAFLELVHTTIDNATVCVGAFSTASASVCLTPACPGAVVGCPVTIHSGPFGDGGSFIAGRFSASGSADNVTVPAFVAPSSSCTYTASNIALGYAPDYAFTDDGNRGAYAALVNRFDATVTNSSFTTDSSVPDCQIAAANIGSVFAAYVQATLSANLRQKLQTATASESVCPLSP